MNARASRRAAGAVLALLLLVAAAAGLWRSSASAPQSADDRAHAVATQLRCPSCAGQSVAESQSEVALAMRAQIRTQIDAGRSPDDVRAWFAQRYGDGVLLAPRARGAAGLVWVLPALLVAGVAGAAWLSPRGSTSGRRVARVAAGVSAAAAARRRPD